MLTQRPTAFCELSSELKNREITSVTKISRDFENLFELKKFRDKALTSDGKKIDNYTVKIFDISPKDFEVLLRYIYNGHILLDGRSSLEIFNLLLAALKLNLEEAASYLQLSLVKYHHEWLYRNFSLVYDTCKQYPKLGLLLSYCMKYPNTLFMTENFVKFEKQVLVDLLENHNLEVDVIEIWNMILKWGLVKHPSMNSNPKYWTTEEIKALSKSLEDLIPLIPFHNLSPEQIDHYIQPYRKLFQGSLYEELVQTSRIKYEEKNALNFKIPEAVNSWSHGERPTLSLFICLDVSGSMCYAIHQAKGVILKMIEELLQKGILVEKDITCFFYASSCNEVRFGDHPNMLWNNGEIKKCFDGVKADGVSNFDSAFKSIIQNLDRVNINNDLAIVFFTDGQASLPVREEAKKELEGALLKTPYTTVVHTIGFKKDHDASLLSWLTKSGSKEGNFMHIENSREISNISSAMIPLLEQTLDVKVGNREPMAEQFDDRTAIHKGRRSPMTIQSIIYCILHEIQIFANEIINHIERNEYERIQRILAEVEKYEEHLNGILPMTPPKILEIHDDIIQDTKHTIDEFKIILTKKSDGSLTNEKIAKFNDLIYKNICELKNPTIFKLPIREIDDGHSTSASDNTNDTPTSNDKSISLLLDKINSLEDKINNTATSDDKSISLLLDKINSLEANINNTPTSDDKSISLLLDKINSLEANINNTPTINDKSISLLLDKINSLEDKIKNTTTSEDKSISLLLDKINSLEANIDQKFDSLQSSIIKAEKETDNQDNKKVEETDDPDNQEVEEKETGGQDIQKIEEKETSGQDIQKVEEKETIGQDIQEVEEKETIDQDKQKIQKSIEMVKKSIRCGSKVIFVHVSTGRYLTARKSQRGVIAVVSLAHDIDPNNDLWTITEVKSSRGISKKRPVRLNTNIRLKHKETSRNLHCASIETNSNSQCMHVKNASTKRKVTLYPGNNSDDNWLIQRCESNSNKNHLVNGDIVFLVHSAIKDHALYYCDTDDKAQGVHCYGIGEENNKIRVITRHSDASCDVKCPRDTMAEIGNYDVMQVDASKTNK
ncbi:13036_t:CDS:10 [Acaulospora morrowiae]|uniref:13036_t:CDS:1 n=1 Tax=Acaulospora morrowiae TaxID=94023 RepID=A0A9N9B728_9GLOM|nr:13036_t:CDS:10 [Acaulospora morrowiae]